MRTPVASVLIAVVALLANLVSVSAETISLSANAGSSLTVVAALPELMRQGTLSVPVGGTSNQNLTFGTVGAFGTVATAAQLQGGSLLVPNLPAITIDLEFLGTVTLSGLNLAITGNGPNNAFTAPPLAAGKTRVPLTGSSLKIVGGTATLSGEGFVAGSLGTVNFNFATNNLTMPFPAGAFMDVTVNGNTVTESIPLNVSGALFTTPLLATLGLSGTLNLTGMRAGCVISSLVGDANNDCNVGAADYAIWAATFGQTGACLPADFDRNGNIGAADYALWAANFGETCPPAAAGVPEPSTALLALLACLALGCGWRRR